MGVIYCTTNLVNGKKYIGLCSNNRKHYLGSGVFLKQAIKKYGKINFKKQILAETEDNEFLNELEKYYIEYFGAVKSNLFYNIGDGSKSGDVISMHPNRDRICKNISNGLKNSEKYYTVARSESRNKKISEANKGRKQTSEAKLKISEGLKNSEKRKIYFKLKAKKRELKRKEIEFYKNLKFECIHCKKIVNQGILTRWHNNNCKLNPNITDEQLNKRCWNKGLKMTEDYKLKNKLKLIEIRKNKT